MVTGRISSFVAFVIIFLAVVYYISLARKGRRPKMRKMAGLDAVAEGVGRATEMGKPIFYTPGLGDVTGSDAASTLAALEILGHVADLTAKYSTRIIVGVNKAVVFPLAEQVVHQSYVQQGKPNEFTPDMIQFLSPMQFAYAAACMGIIHREQAATAIFTGHYLGESVMLAEAAAQVGAIAVAGTTSTVQLPFFVAACDYTLIGEELLAAGAYLSNDPVKLGSIEGQDIIKLIAIAVVICGALLTSFNVKILTNLFKM
jgi:hypothetical protein